MPYGRFTLQQCAFIIEHYFRTRSYAAVIAAFQEEFEGVEPPTGSTIKRLVDKFRTNYRHMQHRTHATTRIQQLDKTVESM